MHEQPSTGEKAQDCANGGGNGKEKETEKDDGEEDQCAICFEKPTTYGLMTGCDHVFCLVCIRAWRDSTKSAIAPQTTDDPDPPALASTSKTCPLCRTKTTYVIPSQIFPHPPKSGGPNLQKAEIERVYLLRCKRIPCRYFTASLLEDGEAGEADARWSRDNGRGRGRGRGGGRSGGSHPRRERGPWCPFGNDCHYLHVKDNQNYTFSEHELSRFAFARRAAARRRHIAAHRMFDELELIVGFVPDYDLGVLDEDNEPDSFSDWYNEDDEDDEDFEFRLRRRGGDYDFEYAIGAAHEWDAEDALEHAQDGGENDWAAEPWSSAAW